MSRQGFDHWLGQNQHLMPYKLNPGLLVNYYWFLRHSAVEKNRQIAAHRIICSHIRLGMAIVGTYYHPNKSSDLFVSEMLWALVKGVDLIKYGAIDGHGEEPNVTGYLVMSIRRHIEKFMYGKEHRYEKGKIATIGPINGHEGVAKGGDTTEIMELLDFLIITDDEREIVKWRIVGLSDQEIGDKIDLSQTHVYRIRNKLFQRVKEFL